MKHWSGSRFRSYSFGHAGEEELNKCMKKHGGFDHNIQTLELYYF